MKKNKLGDFVKIRTGKLDANASSPDGKYPFFTCSKKPLKISSYSFDCKCVLVAGNGDLNIKYYEGKFDAYQRTYIIESKDESILDTRYLYWFLFKYVEKLRELSIGGVIKYIKLNNLTDPIILIPSLEEQKRIVKILDEADALSQKRKQAIRLLDDYVNATFFSMFVENSEEKNIPFIKLESLSLKITDGVHARPKYTESGVPFISVKNITTTKLRFDDCKFVSLADHQSFTKRCKVEFDDILYTKVGATYGRACVVDTDKEFSLYVSVALIKPKKDLVDPVFLKAVLNSSYVKRQADKSVKGAGVPDLHLIEIKKFKIPLPNLKEQKKFAKLVSEVEIIKQRMFAQSEELGTQFQALMQKAFKGEL